MPRLLSAVSACLLVLIAAACGGAGGGGGSPSVPVAFPSPQGVAARVVLTIPAASSSAVKRAYVSPNTASVRIHVVSVNGGAPNPPIADVVASVTASSGGCASSAAGVTCTLSITLPGKASVVLAITTYDASNNVLSTGTTATIDTSVPNPTASLSLGGTVASVTVGSPIQSAPADGGTHLLVFPIVAKDASGATIVAPGPYTAPISISVANDPHGALSLSTSSITSPTVSGVTNLTVTYDSSKALVNGQIVVNATMAAQINPLIYNPSSLTATVGGGTQTVTVSEAGNTAAFTPGGNSPYLTYTCVPASCAPSTTGGSVTFTFTATSGGTGTLLIGDALSTHAQVGFTVTGPTSGNVTVPVYSIFEYSVPTAGAQPGGISISADGKNLFFTEGSNQKIGEVFVSTCVDGTPPSGACTIGDEALGSGYNPIGISAGPDGNMYALSNANNSVEQIQSSTCGSANPLTCAHAPVPGVTPGPIAMALSRDGLLFVAENQGGAPAVSAFQVNTSPCCSKPFGDTLTGGGTPFGGIAGGPTGAMWYTDTANLKIGAITCASFCSSTEYSVPGVLSLGPIAATPDGTLWLAQPSPTGSNVIGSVTPGACATSCTQTATALLPAAGSLITSLAYGPDGNLWFTEGGAGKIGFVIISQCTTSCPIREFALPSGSASGPASITAGPDGNMWFTETLSNKIGKVVL